jgi:hypothetical protein
MDTPINLGQEVVEEAQTASELDDKTLQEIMVTGGNTEGLFTPEPELDDDGEVKAINEEIDEEARVKTGAVKEKFGEYIKKFSDDLEKSPGKYMIETPRGNMPVVEAIKQGYDPATRDFTEMSEEAMMNADLEGSTPEDQAAIRSITNPGRAEEEPPVPGGPLGAGQEEGLPPELAAQLQAQAQGQAGAAGPQGQALPQEVDPGLLQALGGGQ